MVDILENIPMGVTSTSLIARQERLSDRRGKQTGMSLALDPALVSVLLAEQGHRTNDDPKDDADCAQNPEQEIQNTADQQNPQNEEKDSYSDSAE